MEIWRPDPLPCILVEIPLGTGFDTHTQGRLAAHSGFFSSIQKPSASARRVPLGQVEVDDGVDSCAGCLWWVCILAMRGTGVGRRRRLYVGNCAGGEGNVESEEVEIINRFKLHGVPG